MTKEVLKDLLEAVDLAIYSGDWRVDGACDPDSAIQRAREALAKDKALQALHDENERLGLYKDAYAQPEQEPVAWMYESVCGNDFATRNKPPDYAKNIRPLYTTPPQRTWVGLTDREKSNLWLESRAAIPRFHTYASLVEAKLKEKNGL